MFDVLFSGFNRDGSAVLCRIPGCGGSLEPVASDRMEWVCARCEAAYGCAASEEITEPDEQHNAVDRVGMNNESPLVASARIHLDASVTFSADCARARQKDLEHLESLVDWAQIHSREREEYLHGARHGWRFAKLPAGWSTVNEYGKLTATLTTMRPLKPRHCAACRATIVRGEVCYTEVRAPGHYRYHGDSRWCVPCVERTAREVMPENVVRLNARRRAAT